MGFSLDRITPPKISPPEKRGKRDFHFFPSVESPMKQIRVSLWQRLWQMPQQPSDQAGSSAARLRIRQSSMALRIASGAKLLQSILYSGIPPSFWATAALLIA